MMGLASDKLRLAGQCYDMASVLGDFEHGGDVVGCWYWPPVCDVCPNYEVVDFQPQTLTTLDLGSVAYFYYLI